MCRSARFSRELCQKVFRCFVPLGHDVFRKEQDVSV